MKRKFLVVLRKEVIDNLRDRRSLMSSFILPILYPLLLGGVVFMTGSKIRGSKKPVKMVVAGAKHAPALVEYLKRNQVLITHRETGLRKLVKKGKFKVGLRIPKGFSKEFRNAEPARLKLVVDSSRQWGKKQVRKAISLIAAYGQKIGHMRLLARGIHPQVVHPFALEQVDVATPQGFSAMILSALPMLLLVVIFMGGLYIAIDTTAGEFERGSLEPLLINPVTRAEFLLGKYLSTVLFAGVGLLISVIGFGLLPFVISTEQLGFEIHLSPLVMAKVFLLCIPLTLLASALQMLLATLSKSFKEAQSKLSMFVLIPMVPGMILMFTTVKPQWWAMLLPTLGEQILINALLRGDYVQPGFYALSMLMTTAIGLACFWVSTRFYEGERLFLRQ